MATNAVAVTKLINADEVRDGRLQRDGVALEPIRLRC
jgi:hypothetical protein